MQTRTQTPPPDVPRVTEPRRRWRRWAIGFLALLVLSAAVTGYLYGPQIVSMLTHRKGAPPSTEPVRPFAPGDRPSLRIAVVGDVGEGEEEEWQTADAMRQLERENPPYDDLLLLGDNVYPSGDPERLGTTVFGPFGALLDAGTELYAILGNHDVLGGQGAEQMAALGMPGTWWTTSLGDVRLIGLDSNAVDDPAQQAFLEETLATATEPFKIVAIHESPYSAGYQGSNLQVRERYVPLFERYGVQLVLSGHDHDYQRSVVIDGVTYVVSGAGGRTRGTGEEPFTAVSWSTLSYVDLNVYPDHLLVRAIDQEGRMFDSFEIPVSRT